MAPVELEIQSDSEVESIEESDSDSDRSSFEEDNDFEQRQKQQGANQVRDIASGDTQRVRAWKVFVLILMVATTSCVSAGAYYFLKKDENDDYHSSVCSTMNGTCALHLLPVCPFSLDSSLFGVFHSTNSLSTLFVTQCRTTS